MLTTIGKKLSLLCLVGLVSCLDAEAAGTGITTAQTKTAAPNALNLSVTSPAEGTSLSHARADHTHGVTGVLAEPNGGTGVASLNCTAFATPYASANGTNFTCTGIDFGNVAQFNGFLGQNQGGTGSTALTCTNQFVTSNGNAYSCSTDTLASAQHANQGTTSQVLIGNAAGNPSWGVVPAAANNVQTDATLTGAGTSGSNLGIALTHANTWTGQQTFSPSTSGLPGAIFNGASGSGNAFTATGGAATSVGVQGGSGGSMTAGASLAPASGAGTSGGVGGTAVGTAGSNGVTNGQGGLGGSGFQVTSGNGGLAVGANPGGAGGACYAVGSSGSGGAGGFATAGAGGNGGDLFNGFTLGNGGGGGSGGGTGGIGGGGGVWTFGNGGVPGTATTIGGKGGSWIVNTGTGGTASGAGTGGQGGSITFNFGAGGATTGGTGGAGGGMTLIAGNGGSSNAAGGDTLVITSGNGTGTGTNGDGLRVGTGSGGTGTTRGWVMEMTQNNTIHAHFNENPLAADPSSLSNGDDWTVGATTSMTRKVRLNGVTQPVLTGGANGARAVQTVRTAGCATAASLNATCTTTVTWPVAFPDANYTVTCTGAAITSGVPVLQGASAAPIAASATIQTLSITAAAAQFTNVECIAVHD